MIFTSLFSISFIFTLYYCFPLALDFSNFLKWIIDFRPFIFFFFRNSLFSINQISILVEVCGSSTSVWKKSLRPLGGGYYPFRGLGGGGCRPVFSGRLSTPVFSGELLNGHGRHLHAFRPVCHLRLSSRELWSWSGPFTLKLLLGHSLLSCCLLFLFNLV